MNEPRFGATLAALVACAACQGAPRSDAVRGERSAVVNGERSRPGAEDAVLLLRTEVEGRELVCSSSLVAPNLVLTARHCVSHLVEGLFSCTVRGELVETGDGAGRLGVHLPAAELEFYDNDLPREAPLARGELVLSTLSETICQNDVAFVVLDRALELPTFPLRLDGRARTGELATLVGYGLDETQDETEPFDVRTQARTRKTNLVITDVGPDSLEDGVTTAPPRSVVLEGPSGCIGDSGGPLLAKRTNAVLGVYSLLGGESCLAADARHLFAHVPPFRALLAEAFLAAGAEPLPEPEPRAIGEPCRDALECDGERCIEFPGAGRRCTRPCADDECPESYECDAEVADEPLCLPAPTDGGSEPDGAAGAPGAAGAVGDAGSPSEPVRPPRSSDTGGCSVRDHARDRSAWALLVLVAFSGSGFARRRQRRPSSGSTGGGGCGG